MRQTTIFYTNRIPIKSSNRNKDFIANPGLWLRACLRAIVTGCSLTGFSSKTFRVLLVIALMLGFTTSSFSQDIEGMAKAKPVKFSGGLGLSTTINSTDKGSPNHSPFSWSISGNPTLSVYGINLPFSFILSEKNRSFSQPFNQFGMSPSYKWLKLHVGHRSMNFSKYTLSGHNFLGAGLELEPKGFRLSLMSGRLKKEVLADTGSSEAFEPTFKRMGVGGKIGFGVKSNFVDLMAFKAWDEYDTARHDLDLYKDKPQENLVAGIKTHQLIAKKVFIDLDAAASLHTPSPFKDTVDFDSLGVDVPDFVLNVFNPNYNTSLGTALSGDLGFNHRSFTAKLSYQKIDAEFRTLGSYYFPRDREAYTLTSSFGLAKNALYVTTSLGFEKNNTDDKKLTQTHRRIGSLNLSYAAPKGFAFNASYSNFTMDQGPLPDAYDRDTFLVAQVNHNLNTHFSYRIKKKTNKKISHGFSLSSFLQQFADKNPIYGDTLNTSGLGNTLSYKYRDGQKDYNVGVNLSLSNTSSSAVDIQRLGIGLSGGKSLMEKKLKIRASTKYYINAKNGDGNGSSLNFNTSASYALPKSQSLALSCRFNTRSATQSNEESFNDLIIQASYRISFKTK